MKYTWKATGSGAVDNLGKQVQKVVRTMNENKFETRHRYIQAEERFVKFLAKEYNTKKIANVQDKHLEKYVEHLRKNGCADRYIKTELSGIRFFHNHTPGTRHELMDSTKFSREVGLSATPDGRADRAWTEREIERMKDIAVERERMDIAGVIEAVRATGMRLDEACTLRRDQVEKALKTGFLSLKNTKGGRPRDIPMTDRAKEYFQKEIQHVKRGEYVLTPKSYVQEHKIHRFEKSVQNFVGYYRDKIQDSDRNMTGHNTDKSERGALTIHGLRHSYAREEYLKLREQGLGKDQARMEVAEQLGHSRDSVTFIYLGGVE